MNIYHLTSDKILQFLFGELMDDSERVKISEHLKICSECQRAFDSVARSMEDILASWSGKIEGCPSFDVIYNTVFNLPDGMKQTELDEHLKRCNSCREEYELIKIGPDPDSISPEDPDYSESMVNSAKNAVDRHFAQKERKPSEIGITDRVREFLREVGAAATVISAQAVPAVVSVRSFKRGQEPSGETPTPRTERKEITVEWDRAYVAIACKEEATITIKVFDSDGKEITSKEGQIPGVFDLEVSEPGKYFIEAKDSLNRPYNINLEQE